INCSSVVRGAGVIWTMSSSLTTSWSMSAGPAETIGTSCQAELVKMAERGAGGAVGLELKSVFLSGFFLAAFFGGSLSAAWDGLRGREMSPATVATTKIDNNRWRA